MCAAVAAAMGWSAPTAEDPFRPDVVWGDGTLTVTFAMARPDQHIYDDMLACSLGAPRSTPAAGKDAEGRAIYEGLAEFTWKVSAGRSFTLDYQGCDATQCYMPQSLALTITPSGAVVGADGSPDAGVPGAVVADGVAKVRGALPPLAGATEPPPNIAVPLALRSPDPLLAARHVAGFVAPEAFVAFLRGETAAAGVGEGPSFLGDPRAWVAAHGLWLLVLMVFVGGLALNLTPCVLPMMPINLAIIGAGAAGGGRLRGALRGGAYGLGIALAYGALALIPVLTGAAFGAVQSAWWFNAAIAVVFVALALALFDVFMIDFARFSGAGGGRQGAVAAFVAGAVSAVLAGACVAPVLISVLLLTSAYVAEGAWWALCLPFVLGLGMAAPWPVAGAGLSFLPRPGAWMVWVKKGFGVVVLLFALHYGWVAVKALMPPPEGIDGSDLPAVERAVAHAVAEGRPVLLDFWGTACKACEEMERDTFPHPDVRRELGRFTLLKVRMDLSDRAIRPVQKRFGVKGLPTYVILEPSMSSPTP